MVATFDPDTNEVVRAPADRAWQTAEDPSIHFEYWGAMIRRLIASVKFHGKHDPRGYCRWIPGFAAKFSPELMDGKIQWVVWTKSDLETGFSLPRREPGPDAD